MIDAIEIEVVDEGSEVRGTIALPAVPRTGDQLVVAVDGEGDVTFEVVKIVFGNLEFERLVVSEMRTIAVVKRTGDEPSQVWFT